LDLLRSHLKKKEGTGTSGEATLSFWQRGKLKTFPGGVGGGKKDTGAASYCFGKGKGPFFASRGGGPISG